MAKTGDGESLGTAEGAVMGRATHTLHTESPVLNDTWAIDLPGHGRPEDVRRLALAPGPGLRPDRTL